MRTAIFLLLALALLLTGCPASDPAIPTSQEAKSPVADQNPAQTNQSQDAPTLEVTDIPSSISEPRLDEIDGVRHAAAFEGDVSLEGSGVTGGGRELNPFLVQIPASAGDLVQVHLRGTFEGGGAGTLTAQVSVPGYSTIVSVPATDAWICKAFYMPSSGMLEIRLFNGATYNGPLNIDAASMSYYANPIATPSADEPNDDGDLATISDKYLGRSIQHEHPGTYDLMRVVDGPVDREDWYKLAKYNAEPELKVTFDTFNQRYGDWQYEITFFDANGVQIGLRTIFKAPVLAKVFTLRKLSVSGVVYMRVAGTPLAGALTTNMAYAQYYLVHEGPLAFNYLTKTIFPPFFPSTLSAVVGGAPSTSAVWHWDYGGGGTCTANCTKMNPTVNMGTPGKYTGSVWIQDGERISRTASFSYTLTCFRWPTFAATWVPPDVPGVIWQEDSEIEGVLLSSGGKPYAITTEGAGDVRSLDTWHRLGQSSQQIALQLAATSHADRIYIAFVDDSTRHLMMWVSSDAIPNQKSDWKLITLDERTVANMPIAIASSGSRLGVRYNTGSGGNQLRFAYSKTRVADRQLDWGTGIVQSEFTPRAQSMTAHANRWWIAQREPGVGRIMIAASRDLAPYAEGHWNSHPLAPESLNDSLANISLLSAGGKLTAIFATALESEHELQLARSTVAIPQTTGDWETHLAISMAPPLGEEEPVIPCHMVALLDDGYVVGLREWYGDLAIWRSCGFEPELESDWCPGTIVRSGFISAQYPREIMGMTMPAEGLFYALYPDGIKIKLHQLRLDFW